MPESVPLVAARPETREPVACPHFGPCGGCTRLDRAYDVELEEKTRALAELVRARPALADVPLRTTRGAARPLFGRTSIKLPFAPSAAGPVAGFFRPGTHAIVDLHGCALQHPLLTALLVRTRALARELGVEAYDERAHRGLLRHLVARVDPEGRRALAGLVVREAGTEAVAALARALFDEFAPRGLVGLVENCNAERTNVILGEHTRPLVGEAHLDETRDGLALRRTLTSFVQGHAEQASVLYAEVLDALGDVRGRHVADLYAGAGPIALRLARAGARVTALERHPAAVADGRDAARRNGLAERVRFVEGDAPAALAEIDADLDALVVDPPRKGLARALVERICALRVPRMVYVSCNPVTLLRDLDGLAPAFVVDELRPVDLFPRTTHLEVVARLRRR
ncbi:MAG: 23S rRNA (uracil(1939)-C(5))-methyltransferase RlmD [Planctomycetes bacterium]|nr:23S rRNA (uracil(1939)-C(5))-methyltransferase RlmD [Planctomycetota bacterium]